VSISKLLFGEIALKKKLVTKEQVEECLEIQRKLKEMGITKTLGAVMHDKKYLSMVEIKEILREMTGTKDWNAIEGYEILGKLGKGGMGSVYKARHQKLDRLVALKVLPPELAGDQEYLDRFLREARAAAKLNHPNIVQALDVGESYGYQYFAMEYVEGKTVKEMIEQEGSIEEARALDIVSQIAEALVHAWKNGMVHRDIKPSNIIVTPEGRAKLCDLGLAKHVSDDSAITQTGVIMGTPFYLSPEQARCEELDCRSDIYSLGVTLFHMLTGQVPFTGNSAATILYKHIFLEPPKPKSLNPKISSATSQLCVRMLAKKPEERPENPQVLLEELKAAARGLEGRAALAASSPAPARTGKVVEDVKTSEMPALDSGAIRKEKDLVETVSEPKGPENTSTLTAGTLATIEALREGRAEVRKARPRPTPLRRALFWTPLASFVGLAALVFVRTIPPPAPGAVADPARVVAAALGAAPLAPEISQALLRAEALVMEKKFGAAARELEAVGRVPDLGTAADAEIRKASDMLAAAAIRDFQALDEQYQKQQKEGGDPGAIASAIESLDLPSIVILREAERGRLRAELKKLKPEREKVP
jgi:serine/threonine-protein kinase